MTIRCVAAIAFGIGAALFWFGVARLFTDDRRILVPLFVIQALLMGWIVMRVQSRTRSQEV